MGELRNGGLERMVGKGNDEGRETWGRRERELGNERRMKERNGERKRWEWERREVENGIEMEC